MKRWQLCLSGLVLGVAVSGNSVGWTADETARARLQAASPGEHHKKLEPLVGSWNVTARVWMTPDAPPEESKATATHRWILGGRFVQQIYRGRFLGQPFQGIGLIGYDNTAGKFTSNWVDSTSTGIMRGSGTMDAGSKVLSMEDTFLDPVTRKEKTSRWTTRIEGPDRHVTEGYESDAQGNTRRILELVYTRRPGKERVGDTEKKPEAAVLEVGDRAPRFWAMTDAGERWKSADHVGERILVIYFYPADMTGGCTKQACGFRDDMKSLQKRGVSVVGVSGDSVRNHRLFKKAYDLNFTLLADPKGQVARRFGVPLRDGGSIEREIDGEEVTLTRSVTAARWTFVIDKQGRIAYKDTEVDAAGDSKKILEVIEKLEKASTF